MKLQVILFEIDCVIFYTNLHELFCQYFFLFLVWTFWEHNNLIWLTVTEIKN